MSDLLQQFSEARCAGGHRVILADPPWPFENRSEKGEGKNPNQHYPCMEIEEICALPVASLAARNCALFLWVTWPLMPRWMEVIRAWQFDYAGLAWEWLKFNPETEKFAFGPGYGTRKNVEPCLLCTRGDPQLRKESVGSLFGDHVIPAGVHSVRDFILAMPTDCIRAPRREHSRKPEEQYQRIETMFDGRYVELFARHKRPGWNALGNQTDKFGAVS